jgi:hypothetical protein
VSCASDRVYITLYNRPAFPFTVIFAVILFVKREIQKDSVNIRTRVKSVARVSFYASSQF